MYAIQLTTAAERDLRKVARANRTAARRVVDAIEDLKTEPRPEGMTRLKGSERSYRIRVGDFRVLHDIEDEALLVTVIRIANRRDAY